MRLLPLAQGGKFFYKNFPQLGVEGYGERVTLHQKNNDGERIILCNGCSFTQSREGESGTLWATWADYIPGKVFNISITGSSVESQRVVDFVKSVPEKFTHFIYQVPIYLRQMMYSDLNRYEFFNADPSVKRVWPKHCLEYDLDVSDTPLFKQFQSQNVMMYRDDIFDFETYELYAKKSIYIIAKTLGFLRDKFPDIKMIMLKYNHAGGYYKKYETLTKKFFNRDLRDFADNNNIDYIYNKNFNTYYFYRNGMTIDDKTHMNSKGAQMIGEEVAKFL